MWWRICLPVAMRRRLWTNIIPVSRVPITLMSPRPFGELRHRTSYRLALSLCLFAASAAVYWQHHRNLPPAKRTIASLPAVKPAPQPLVASAEPPKPEAAPPPAAAASENNNEAVPAEQPKERVAAKPRPPALYKDGEFTGNPVDIEYGLVQVGAIVTDGRITGIKWLQDPEDIDLSKQINQDAMPKLTREAITAQKSEVDLVTGATFTALGFRLSLSTALAQAANNPP